MGRISETVLYQILLAAVRYAHVDEPAGPINQYILDNNLLPENFRADRGRSEVWRDYQQIFSELGLIISTELTNSITPTPLGLAFLDGTIEYPQLMAMQALRYQYPNGHNLQISPPQRALLVGTMMQDVPNVALLQHRTGVRIRPGALIWRVLRMLQQNGAQPRLSVPEIESCLMRCAKNGEATAVAAAIVASRINGAGLIAAGDRNHRNAQDWIKFLLYTPLFAGATRRNAFVEISDYGLKHADHIDSICASLEDEASFWIPSDLRRADRISWYATFGSVDLALPFVPLVDGQAPEVVEIEDPADIPADYDEDFATGRRQLQLREFDGTAAAAGDNPGGIIRAEYDAERTRGATRLHNSMLDLIARVCTKNGAMVYEDPQSVDLFVVYGGEEFIVEVKSVTPSNFMQRLRYAIGQVLHYDYKRSLESAAPRRRVIALAATVPDDAWVIEFLRDHLEIDLLTLDGAHLRLHSKSPTAAAVFAM